MMSDDEGEGQQNRHFSFPAIVRSEAAKNKGKKRRAKEGDEAEQADDFKVDVSDPRFKELFESHHYAPDPSHPQYKWAWHVGVVWVSVLSFFLYLEPLEA